MSRKDTTRITRYLLGQLPPEERDRTEEELLKHRELFELAESVEDDLVDRYARDELPGDERRRFERRLLQSARIRQRLEVARALAAHERRRAVATSKAGRRPARAARRRPGVVLAWAATVAALVAGGWFSFQAAQHEDRIRELESERSLMAERLDEEVARAARAEAAAEGTEESHRRASELEERLAAAREQLAELEETPATPPERRVRTGSGDYGDAARTATVFLSLATRSTGGPETLRLEGSGRAELQLDLAGRRPAEPVGATVFRDGLVVWREADLAVESLGPESMARLTLPEQVLQEGRYRVEITAGAGEVFGSYELSVER